jgi:CPA2 family monovalent cation:H+ antiporter-2
LLRVLADRGDLHTPAGHIAVGWLVVEDLFTVLVLVLLPALPAIKQNAGAGLPLVLGLAVLKIVALVLFTILVGGRVIPWLLEHVARTRSRELFTLTVLVLAMGIAVGSARLFGVSAALGAFLAGIVVGRSEFSLRAASDALPMRDAFAVLFFVSVGMLFSPRAVVEMPGLIAATCGVILIGKPMAALAIVLVLRYPFKVALAVAVSLAQIGEFSFILATLARDMDILTADAMNTLVAASIFSITINPLLYRFVDPLEAWVMRRKGIVAWVKLPGLTRRAAPPVAAIDPPVVPRNRAIVVGYGPVGQTLTRLLRDNEIVPTVIELNLDTFRRLRDSGVNAVYGDAGQRATLASADVRNAGTLILSASGLSNCEEIIRQAREMNPTIRVLARTTYVREIEKLVQAGAAGVFSGEGEVALALIEAILRPLGATAEQIDRERDCFRNEVLRATKSP